MSYSPPLGNILYFDFTSFLISLYFDFIGSAYSPPVGDSISFDFVVPLISLDFEFAPEVPPPITKEMLLSLGIRFHGQVYKYWICQISHGVQQVRRYSIPPDPKTLPQLRLRSKWAAGVLSWQNLSDSDKLYWRRIGVRKLKPITSLNAFLSAWMKDKLNVLTWRLY